MAIRWRALHRRKTPHKKILPLQDFRRLQCINRYAGSQMIGTNLWIKPQIKKCIYQIKDILLHHFGKNIGYILQEWSSTAYEYGYDYEGVSDGAWHQHILECWQIRGITLHRPTGHFRYDNTLSGYYKKSVGFEIVAEQTKRKMSGRKSVSTAPTVGEAMNALKILEERYGELSAPAKPYYQIITGNSDEDEWYRLPSEDELEQCHFCLKNFPAFFLNNHNNHYFCNSCLTAVKGASFL